MLYVFMGQSCTGKSTMIDKVKQFINVEVYTGKDYLRTAKSESEAWKLFYEKLLNATSDRDLSKIPIIYLITEKAQLDKIIDIEDSYKVKFSAPIDTIKLRFAQRMNGRLPQPVESMLINQYKEWENIKGDIEVDTTIKDDVEKLLNLIKGQ